MLEGLAHQVAFLSTHCNDPSKRPEASGPAGPLIPLWHLSLRPALLNSAENFTVFIKNNIDFPGHNYTM